MNRLLTADEIALLLGVKKSTIYQWTHQDFIPHVKLRNLVRFKEDDVMAWIDKLSTKGRRKRVPELK